MHFGKLSDEYRQKIRCGHFHRPTPVLKPRYAVQVAVNSFDDSYDSTIRRFTASRDRLTLFVHTLFISMKMAYGSQTSSRCSMGP